MIPFVIALVGVFILGLIVFGGGQVFMPLFNSLWQMMAAHGANIDQSTIDNMFTIANATPGVVATKFALFTGYLSANGEWWGWLAMFLTYLIFVVPSIIMVIVAFKMVRKSKTHPLLKNVTYFLRPVLIGILASLSVQLIISTAFPQVIFNGSVYTGLEFNDKWEFFDGWRFYVGIAYTVIVIVESFILYKKNVNLFVLIISHIVAGMIIFEPWL